MTVLRTTLFRISTRWGGAAAIMGGILGVVLTPFMASIWAFEGGTAVWEDKLQWLVRIFGPVLEQAGFLTFAPEHVVYYTYGRFYFLVYLLILGGVIAFHAALPQSVQDYGNLRERYRLLILGLSIALVGDIGGYLGNSEPDFNSIQAAGAFIEIVGLIVILGGSLIYGRGLLKAGIDPHWPAWLLILSAPAGILGMFLLVYYFPNGPMFFFCSTWIVLGYWTLNQGRQASVAAGLP